MIFNDAEIEVLKSGMQRIGIFFRLNVDPVVRLWLGVGKIDPGVSTFDPLGATYLGFGAINQVPPIKQLLNGTAERVDFIVSGVSGEILTIATGADAQAVKGKEVAVGFAIMGLSWELLGGVKWSAQYVADFVSVNQSVADQDQPTVRTVRLSAGSRFTGRRRPSYSFFTDTDQQARYPGDLFCEFTPRYANGFNKAWPTFPPP